MSNPITKTFERMDLPRIREYLQYGASEHVLEPEAYEAYNTRLKRAGEGIYARINGLYTENSDEHTEAINDLTEVLAAHGEVYMEIGMKAGARLIYQLLLTENPIPPQKGEQNEPK